MELLAELLEAGIHPRLLAPGREKLTPARSFTPRPRSQVLYESARLPLIKLEHRQDGR